MRKNSEEIESVMANAYKLYEKLNEMDVPEDMDVSGQPASGANNKLLLAGGGVAFVAVIAAIVFAVKFIKKRKEAKQQKDDENEIS